MIHSKHTIGWCPQCHGDRVICAGCGNNCCNGGSGRTTRGKDCDCDEAYAHQDMHWKLEGSVKFAKDTREQDKLQHEWATRV